MNKKLIGILVCILFFGASIVPSIAGYDKDLEKIDIILSENETLNMKNDERNNLIKQVIEGGVILKSNWLEQDKLLASDGAEDDRFGLSVSIDGDYAIVGADGDDSGGSAYVFKRGGSSWVQEAKLRALDGTGGFGCSVSIDGDSVIVGAFWFDSAYIFTRSGTTWTEQAKLIASDGAADDWFGFSVSIDGDYAIVGAYVDDDNGYRSGSAYIFNRSGTTWTEQAKLLASDGAAEDRFGRSVSISGDYAIIGAEGDDDNGVSSGSAYIFTRSGSTWTEQAKLLASDGAGSDIFGQSVSIDGDYAIVGAWGDNDNGGASGSAYIFTRSGSTWTEQAKLLASDGAASDHFAWSVSIDGDSVIAGAIGDDDNGERSGSAYIFNRSGTTWTEQAKLLASDGAADDWFGWSVSISGDYAIIGAEGDDDNGYHSGSAYVFKRNRPPATPIITGPENGVPGNSYTYNFSATDPNQHQVEYYIEWGDGNFENWFGPFNSGIPQNKSHTWAVKDTYTVRCKARDEFAAESDWGELQVTMPRNHVINTPFLNWLQSHPNLFPILQLLIQKLGLQ